MESFIWKTVRSPYPTCRVSIELDEVRWSETCQTHLPEIFALFPKEVIITADQYAGRAGKPAPDIYLIAANALGMCPQSFSIPYSDPEPDRLRDCPPD